jgi:hypothetical protein
MGPALPPASLQSPISPDRILRICEVVREWTPAAGEAMKVIASCANGT